MSQSSFTVKLYFSPESENMSSECTDEGTLRELVNNHLIGDVYTLYVEGEYIAPGAGHNYGEVFWHENGNLAVEDEFFKAIHFPLNAIVNINFQRKTIRIDTPRPTYVRRYERGSEPRRKK